MDRRASASCVVQTWPDGGTNWRGSSQIGQRSGSFDEGENWVPQVTQIKAGMTGLKDERATPLESGRRAQL